MQAMDNVSTTTEYTAPRDRYDRICKKLLSQKIILGWILHECLEEFANVDPGEIASRWIEGTPSVGQIPVHADDEASMRIEGMANEDSSLAEGTVWYDIRFSAQVPSSEEPVGIIVNVEPQGSFNPGYPLLKRAMYYCARMISSQYGRVFSHSHYERLQKVYSLWICPHPSADFRNTITRYRMQELQVIGDATADEDSYDLIEVLLVCPDGDRQAEGDGILRLLGVLLGSERKAAERRDVLSNEFGISITKELSDEVEEMSSLSEGILEEGYEQGRRLGLDVGRKEGFARGYDEGHGVGYDEGHSTGYDEGHSTGYDEGRHAGFDEGREAGMNEGRSEVIVLGARNLMQKLGVSAQDALNTLGVPLSEQERYLALL